MLSCKHLCGAWTFLKFIENLQLPTLALENDYKKNDSRNQIRIRQEEDEPMNHKKTKRYFKRFTHYDFASMLDMYRYQLNIGDITGGTIFSHEKKGFLVDIGENIAAYLPENEVSVDKHTATLPLINNAREFFIIACNKKAKQLIVSIKRLEYIRGWRRIKQIKQEDAIINLQINQANKGGLVANLEGIQCFIPNSHIVNTKNKYALVKIKIECQILFINEKTNTVILSQKRAVLKKLLSEIHVGKNVTGVITKIQEYGVFIDISGFIALLHVSEIDNENKRIEVMNVGDHIHVRIIHIDIQQGRLAVSTKTSD